MPLTGLEHYERDFKQCKGGAECLAFCTTVTPSLELKGKVRELELAIWESETCRW